MYTLIESSITIKFVPYFSNSKSNNNKTQWKEEEAQTHK
jgi:hypothetical protein